MAQTLSPLRPSFGDELHIQFDAIRSQAGRLHKFRLCIFKDRGDRSDCPRFVHLPNLFLTPSTLAICSSAGRRGVIEFFSQFQTAVGVTPTNRASSDAVIPLASLVSLMRFEISSGGELRKLRHFIVIGTPYIRCKSVITEL
jgi:hypothetical protein